MYVKFNSCLFKTCENPDDEQTWCKHLGVHISKTLLLHIQGIHKRMVRFQKLTRNLYLTLHGHKVHRQQRQLFKFLMRYQQFASHAYFGAAGPVSTIASQQVKAFCVLRFEVSRSVITVQRAILETDPAAPK